MRALFVLLVGTCRRCGGASTARGRLAAGCALVLVGVPAHSPCTSRRAAAEPISQRREFANDLHQDRSVSEADDRLRKARQAQHALYPPEYTEPVLPIDDEIAGIVASHSLIPDALHHAFAAFGALMSPDLPLTRRQHEMIATVVSVTNRCFYCSKSHAEFLRRVTLDDRLVEALRRDYRTAPIDDRDRVMLDYVAQVTRDATGVRTRISRDCVPPVSTTRGSCRSR